MPLLLSPYHHLKGLIVRIGWLAWHIEVLTPLLSSPPHTPFFFLCFCADEIKDDFDALGSDALQAVGNGTGELTEHALEHPLITVVLQWKDTFSLGGCDPMLATTYIEEQNNYIDSV